MFSPVVSILPALFALIAFSPALPDEPKQPVQNYVRLSGIISSGGQPLLVLRSFEQDREKEFLCVDMNTLATRVVPAHDIGFEPHPWDTLRMRFAGTPYFKTLQQAGKTDSLLQNAGITHLSKNLAGIILTADLCPSEKPFERGLFTDLLYAFKLRESPLPMALSITGLWMKQHPQELDWLLTLVQENKMDILWINHSFHHNSSPSLPLKENFLLLKGTNISEEVLKTEQMMLENNILPSVFFRFPGLVSDSRFFHSVQSLGLIPVGSDAWLAKNEQPGPGSIVLVHANGNEPLGVVRLKKLLQEKKAKIIDNSWNIIDLRQGIISTSSEWNP